MLTAKNLATLPNIRHGFFTRTSGVSEGVFASLNCGYGSGDDQARVKENRCICARQLSVEESCLVTAYQQHTADAVIAETPWPHDDAPIADAIVTRAPNLAVGILTADCVPVLFADNANGVVAAAHAGWKGALTGILEATIRSMESLGAERGYIKAAVGPSIAQPSYEVGPEFHERFITERADFAQFFESAEKSGHWMFDLPGFVRGNLEALKVPDIDLLGVDTYTDESAFYSYRRACHQSEKHYGRQLSAIAVAQ